MLVPACLRDNTSSSPSTHILMKETVNYLHFVLLVLSQMNKLALSSTEILFHIYLSSLNTHFLCIYLCYSILYIITVYTSYTQYSYSSKFKLSLRSLLQRTISIFSLPHSLLITWVTLVQLSKLIKSFFFGIFDTSCCWADPCIGGVSDDPCRQQLFRWWE